MSDEDPQRDLNRVLKGWNTIRDLLLGMGQDDFLASPDTQDKVIAELITVGEAVGRLPGEVRQQDPYIEWDVIRAWPQTLAVGLASADMKAVWGWATNEMYELRELVTGMDEEG